MFEVSKKSSHTSQKKNSKPKKFHWESHKYLPGIIAIIAIIGVIVWNQYQNNLKNYTYIKKDRSKALIYVKYTNQNNKYPINLPSININSKEMDLANDEIDKLAKDYIQRKNDVITYDYEINGIILSIVLKLVNNNTGYAPVVTFKTYNINLEQKILVKDNDLLELYQQTTQTVEQKIKATFEAFYQDEVAEGYVDANECDYNCFLKWRAVENYLDGTQLYIKKGELIAYRPFIVHSLYGEENYFKDSDFEFPIAKEAVERKD